MFNHALAKGALFLAVSCLAMRVASLKFDDLAGCARSMPWTMAAFLVAGLSLIGVPGTAGFISKWYLITAVFDKGALGIALVAVIIISSLMAVAYIWRIVEIAYFQAPKDGQAIVREAPLELLVVTWCAVLANVYFGLSSELPLSLSTSAADQLLRHLP